MVPRRAIFVFQACNDRPSMPCARAHAPTFIPLRSAARRHRTASRSSSIFVQLTIATSQVLCSVQCAVDDGIPFDFYALLEEGES